MENSYVWITTDDITSRSKLLSVDGLFPDYYRGIIGTMPHIDVMEDDHMKPYNEDDIASESDFLISSVKVSDGLKIIHTSLENLEKTSWNSSPEVNCENTQPWIGGKKLYAEIIRTFQEGLANTNTHHDESPRYDILNFRSDHIRPIGLWEYNSSETLVDQSHRKVDWTERKDIVYLGGGRFPPSGFGRSLTGYHLKIGIVPEPPIAFLADNCVNDTSSPKCWYGWNPDLFEQLATDLNFTYEYVMPDDRKYGGFNRESKRWNGMIGDLIEHKTDISVAMSINIERAKWIEFSASFYEDQAAFVVNEESAKSSSNMFFFLEPFHFSVWLSIIGLILIVALLTTIFGKFSPFGRFGKKYEAAQNCCCSVCAAKKKDENNSTSDPTRTEECLVVKSSEDEARNDMSFYNSTWLVGTGLFQGKIPREIAFLHDSLVYSVVYQSQNLNLIFRMT